MSFFHSSFHISACLQNGQFSFVCGAKSGGEVNWMPNGIKPHEMRCWRDWIDGQWMNIPYGESLLNQLDTSRELWWPKWHTKFQYFGRAMGEAHFTSLVAVMKGGVEGARPKGVYAKQWLNNFRETNKSRVIIWPTYKQTGWRTRFWRWSLCVSIGTSAYKSENCICPPKTKTSVIF